MLSKDQFSLLGLDLLLTVEQNKRRLYPIIVVSYTNEKSSSVISYGSGKKAGWELLKSRDFYGKGRVLKASRCLSDTKKFWVKSGYTLLEDWGFSPPQK